MNYASLHTDRLCTWDLTYNRARQMSVGIGAAAQFPGSSSVRQPADGSKKDIQFSLCLGLVVTGFFAGYCSSSKSASFS